jgi:hypothetical protein
MNLGLAGRVALVSAAIRGWGLLSARALAAEGGGVPGRLARLVYDRFRPAV